MPEISEILRKFREEAENKDAEIQPELDALLTKGHQRFYAGMLSVFLTVALAAHLYRPPVIKADRFVEAGESFTAPAKSVVSGEVSKDLFLGVIGYPLYDGDPTSGEVYIAIEKPVALTARSKVYIRNLRPREDRRKLVESTIEWQALTPTFCESGCDSINIRHNGSGHFVDSIPEATFRNLRGR